jgi:hypothetical protein
VEFRVDPYAVVSPYMTLDVAGSFVLQLIVAEDRVMDEVVIEEEVGAVVSGIPPVVLDTVTVTAVDVFVFPAASLATAVSV